MLLPYEVIIGIAHFLDYRSVSYLLRYLRIPNASQILASMVPQLVEVLHKKYYGAQDKRIAAYKMYRSPSVGD